MGYEGKVVGKIGFDVVAHGSAAWRAPIRFPDYLRSHPEAVREYEALKPQLAVTTDQTDLYTGGKSTFIARILEQSENASTELSCLGNVLSPVASAHRSPISERSGLQSICKLDEIAHHQIGPRLAAFDG